MGRGAIFYCSPWVLLGENLALSAQSSFPLMFLEYFLLSLNSSNHHPINWEGLCLQPPPQDGCPSSRATVLHGRHILCIASLNREKNHTQHPPPAAQAAGCAPEATILPTMPLRFSSGAASPPQATDWLPAATLSLSS